MILFFLTALGLPALALLRRLRAASAVGFVAVAILVGALLGFWWDAPMIEGASIGAAIALFFSLAAKLPYLTSVPM